MSADIVARLRGAAADKYGCNCVKCEAADEIERLTAERDEARRWICQVLARREFVTGLAKPGQGRPHDFAKEQGWDCFKEDKR